MAKRSRASAGDKPRLRKKGARDKPRLRKKGARDKPRLREKGARRSTIEDALLESARSVAAHLRDHPGEPRAVFLASLFRELCAGIAGVPDLPATSTGAADVSEHDRAALRGVVCTVWRDFVRHKALTPERARILAERIALVAEPAVCLVLAHEARSLETACTDAALILERDHAAFMQRAAQLKIDRALLDMMGLDIVAAGAHAQWHADGHLASLTRGQRKLTLAPRPGSGRYVEEGKRGGYGFAVDERYERGAARGVFFSPWHDGDEYATPQPWIAWVTSCAATILRDS